LWRRPSPRRGLLASPVFIRCSACRFKLFYYFLNQIHSPHMTLDYFTTWSAITGVIACGVPAVRNNAGRALRSMTLGVMLFGTTHTIKAVARGTCRWKNWQFNNDLYLVAMDILVHQLPCFLAWKYLPMTGSALLSFVPAGLYRSTLWSLGRHPPYPPRRCISLLGFTSLGLLCICVDKKTGCEWWRKKDFLQLLVR
jgi:hypothetical protein